MNNDVDQYAQQKSLFGDEPAAPHPKGFREELHAREKDNIPNPNRHPGQFAPKGGSNPLLKVVEHEHGWAASAMLKDGKEFRVEGKDRREAIGNAIRAGEKMGVIFDPPAAEPKIGGLFGGSFDEKAHPREQKNHDGKQAGQFAPKQQAEEAPFVLQRPKKNTTIPSFGSNTNTKQSALFDVGKKDELPGQELLFNSDAGDLHNPKTMENKVATPESKSQPDPMAIAQEALSNNENIGITMGRHGVTIKGHPDYRTIRQQVSKHLEELQEQAKPKPSPARQRAMDAQMAKSQEPQPTPQVTPHPFEKSPRVKEDFDFAVKQIDKDPRSIVYAAHSQHPNPEFVPELLKHIRSNHIELFEQLLQKHSKMKGADLATHFALKKIEAPSEPAVKYSKAYEQFEEEAERYFRDYTLYDVDRYGMGGGIMKLILSMMAMHAMAGMINKQSQARQQTQKPSAAAPTTPSNQDFEKLHPRAQTQSGNSKPGQFAKKPEGSAPTPPPQPREARPLTERPDKKTQLSQAPPAQQQQSREQAQAWQDFASKTQIWNPNYNPQSQQESAQEQEQPAPVTPKPWLAEPGSPKPDVTAYDLDPRRGTPEQKAAAMQSRMDRDAGAPQQPVQTPSDPNTARIAEIWHGKESGQADDFGAGVDVTPKTGKQTFDVWHSPKTSSSPTYSGAASAGLGDVFATDNKDYAAQYGTPGKYTATMQNPYQMNSGEFRSFDRGHDASVQKSAKFRKELESKGHDGIIVTHADGVKEHILFNRDSLQPQPLKTEPAALNPRKRTLGDGMTPNPAYNPQQIEPKPIPAKPPRQKPEKAPKLEKAPKPEKPSLLDREASDTGSNTDIFENPAAKARREKAELDRITKFDPTEFGSGIEQPDAPVARPTIQSVQGDYTALEAARNDRAKQVRAFTNWENTTQKDPEANIAEVASEHELDHEPFSNYAKEMQTFEESEWKRREGVKTAIRKAWKVDGGDLKQMENRNQDHSNLQRGDELKGSVNDSDLYEFLGPDEGEWSQNAWSMLREEQPERPGAHDKDWLNGHAENFKRLQSMTQPESEWYPEPEDDMPFSRKSLTREIDRYFQQHLARIRATRAKTESQSWTDLDSWL